MIKTKEFRTICLAMALLLVLSLTVHLIEFDHEHLQEFFGEGLAASMHSEERKLWFALLSVSLLLLAIIISIIARESKNFGKILELINLEAKSRNLLLLLFSSGLLNPRLYE